MPLEKPESASPPSEKQVTFRVRVPKGGAQMNTSLLKATGESLCSATYVDIRRIDEN